MNKKIIISAAIILLLSGCASLSKLSATPENKEGTVKEFRVVGAYARGYR